MFSLSMPRKIFSALSFVFLLGMTGCGSDSALAPRFEPEVTNTANAAFSFQATGLEDITDDLTYTWQVSSGSIVIQPSTATDAGEVTLRIRDSLGALIHEGAISPSGDITPPAGEPGAWSVQIIFSDFSGTINFTLEMQ